MDNPFGLSSIALLAHRVATSSVDVVFTNVPPADPLVNAAFDVFVPQKTIAWASAQGVSPNVTVCRGHSCSLPVSTYRELLRLLSPGGDAPSNA